MNDVLKKVEVSGIVAVIRLHDAEIISDVCRAVAAGGVTALEITMTTPGALEAIAELSKNKDEKTVIAVGTVLDVATAKKAIEAGAEFVVSPIFNKQIMDVCKEAGVPAIPGAYSPTEVYEAFKAGAEVVKIFPASVGGPDFFKAVKAVFPDIKVMPTGGVNLETIPAFVKAGAWALGTGSNLTPKEALANKDWEAITKVAQSFVQAAAEARSQI
jgi:2-dehydro-3-deoxyphosphogluconate aldolase/(4S)-4-hydroxy-2-oxoglutarate aldolase